MKYSRKHDRHSPRSWFNLFVRLGGWACLTLGALLIILTFTSGGLLLVADKIDTDSRFTRGTVQSKRQGEATEDDGSLQAVYFVTFTYKSSEGGQTAESEVVQDVFDGLEAGDERMIRYVHSAPAEIREDNDGFRAAGVFFRVFGLIVGVTGLALLWVFGQQTNLAIKARRDGEKRMAEVTGIEDTNFEVNGERQARLQWREEDGQIGESLMRDRRELSQLYRSGDPVVVFRLGKDSFWEGDVGPPKRESASDK